MEQKILKTFVSDMSVEISLFINPKGQYATRIFDLDVNEVVQISFCKSQSQAEKKFDDLVRNS